MREEGFPFQEISTANTPRDPWTKSRALQAMQDPSITIVHPIPEATYAASCYVTFIPMVNDKKITFYFLSALIVTF
jgi:hypothetical protein